MTVADIIGEKIRRSLKPAHLEIINESHMHAGPATQSHFKVIVASEDFSGLSPVKRHQLLYRLLKDELAGPVHALALHTYTPDEWRSVDTAPASPKCRGSK